MLTSGEQELRQPGAAPRAPLGPSRAENCAEIGEAKKQACAAAAPTVARTPPRQRQSPLRPHQSLLDADDDVCTPSPNVTVRARRKRRRRKALGSAEKTFDANPASPPASPRSLPSTPTIKSPPTAAPLSEPPLRRRTSRRSLDALADGAERASRALPLRERVTFMRQTSRDAGVIHPNSGPRRLWDFCAALVAVAMVLNPNVNVMGSAFFVADAALNLHTGYVDRGGTLILRRGRIMRHYAAGWLLPDVLGALGPSALAAVPAPRRCAVGSYDTWSAPVWKSTYRRRTRHTG